MHLLRALLSGLLRQLSFQFSIGDARRTARSGTTSCRRCVSILYWRCWLDPISRQRFDAVLVSILYWRCLGCVAEVDSNGGLLFQFSIGDAVAFCNPNHRHHERRRFNSLLEMRRLLSRLRRLLKWVSILYWRCVRSGTLSPLATARGFNSLLEMPFNRTTMTARIYVKFQFSIGDASETAARWGYATV